MPAVDYEDAIGLAEQIRAGRISAAEALDAALAREHEVRGLGALSFLDARDAMTAAKALDAGNPAADFSGVPTVIKDLGTSVKGMPTTSGSRSMANRAAPAAEDDLLVGRLRALGFTIFGMTTVCEFGQAFVTEPAIGPLCRNPRDPSRTPGGSSGGAAAAVLSGIVSVAQAGDAAGSIRVPAACCGLVGLKPSRGATTSGPNLTNFANGYVSDFVISRSLRDSAALLDAMSGSKRGPVPSIDFSNTVSRLDDRPPNMKIAVIVEGLRSEQIDPRRAAAINHAAAVLRDAGHTLDPISPREIETLAIDAWASLGTMLAANLSAHLSRLDPRVRDDELEPLTLAGWRQAQTLGATDIIEAQIQGARVAAGVAEQFRRYDSILLPMMTAAPPPVGSFPFDHGDLGDHYGRLSLLVPYGPLANVAGTPSLSIPHGYDDDGLPLPIQLLGPFGSDPLLLRLARLLQNARPWRFDMPVAGSSVIGDMRL